MTAPVQRRTPPGLRWFRGALVNPRNTPKVAPQPKRKRK